MMICDLKQPWKTGKRKVTFNCKSIPQDILATFARIMLMTGNTG